MPTDSGGCHGKKRYQTAQEIHFSRSKAVQRKRKGKKRRIKNQTQVYRCPECGGFHVGESIVK